MPLIASNHSILFLSFDTLRYDVAQTCFETGKTPNLQAILPKGGWEKRHSPASFTYAAHHAFFSGFLPSPSSPGKHPRLFACRFLGSETITENTLVFDTPDILSGLEQLNFETICIGGVGFFNQQTPLSNTLPNLFKQRYWESSFGVTEKQSTQFQFQKAVECLEALPSEQKVFLFINISALHQPNYFYLNHTEKDSLKSHAAALTYIDSQLPLLLNTFRKNRPLCCLFMADHGTTYGEDGYTGHRIGHPLVWDVPYAEFTLSAHE